MIADPGKKTLIIVESPTKAKTISRFLPPTCRVIASMGHIADLAPEPKTGRYGVDVDNDYNLEYVIDAKKKDLIKEMSGQRKGNKIVAVMRSQDDEVAALVDYTVSYDLDDAYENVLLGLDYILFAQTLAVLKSLSLDITPDNPCPTGEVNRVVKGVTLYPYTRK